MIDTVKVTIELCRDDFVRLGENSMLWGGDDGWRDQQEGFHPLNDDHGGINWDAKYAHWFTDAASMILARAYLGGIGESHQVLTDEAGGYVITTDYNCGLL